MFSYLYNLIIYFVFYKIDKMLLFLQIHQNLKVLTNDVCVTSKYKILNFNKIL